MTVLPWRQREPKCVLVELKSLTPGKTRGARHSTVMRPGEGTPYSTRGLSSEKRGGGLCLIIRRCSQAGSAWGLQDVTEGACSSAGRAARPGAAPCLGGALAGPRPLVCPAAPSATSASALSVTLGCPIMPWGPPGERDTAECQPHCPEVSWLSVPWVPSSR